MRLTLKTKIALLGTALVAALMVGIGLWQHHRLANDFHGLLQDEQDAVAGVVAQDLADKLESRLWALDRSALSVGPDLLADAERRRAYVAGGSSARALFDGLALIDLDGRVLASDPALPEGTRIDYAQRNDVRAALAIGQPQVSQPLPADGSGRPSVYFSAPVRDAEGRVAAVLAGRLDLRRPDLMDRIAAAGPGAGLTIVTREAAPRYVYHPDAARLLQPAEPEARSGAIASRRPIRVADWDLQVQLSAAEARAPVAGARGDLFRQVAVVAPGTFAVLWLAAWWLLRPLSNLRDLMRDLGDTPGAEVLLDTSQADERGDLAREFQALMRRLRDQQAQLAAVNDVSPEAMFRAAPDGRLTYVNDAWLQLTGLGREAAAEGWHGLLPDSQRGAARERWLKAVQRDEPFQARHTLRRADGTDVPVALRSAPVRVDGRVQGHVGTLHDLSDDQAAERALRRSEATLLGIADSMPALVWVLDRALQLRFANAALRRWLPPGEPALGLPLASVLGEAEAAALRPAAEAALAGAPGHAEFTDRRGTHFEVTLMPLRLDDGTIDGAVAVASDVTAHKHEASRLRALTRADPLTGVLNRAGFERHLAQRATGKAAAGTALLYIDLDRFKPVNDRHGHPVGDELLRLFAERLRGLVRPNDAVARLGGDEFAIVLGGLRERGHAQIVAEKVLDAAHAPFAIGTLTIGIGASVGIAFPEPGDDGWQALVARADAQLYRAKEAGRGRSAGALPAQPA